MRRAALIAALLAAGCEGYLTFDTPDAGRADASPSVAADAASVGSPDAAPVAGLDASVEPAPDSGTAGSPDAGSPPPDAGPGCGPATCSGCCDGSGTCQAGDSPGACGLHGATCQDCAGKACGGGSCPAQCAPDNCSGCCAIDNSCQPGTENWLCGQGGESCQSCFCQTSRACACLGNWHDQDLVVWDCQGSPFQFHRDSSMPSGVYINTDGTLAHVTTYYIDLCSWTGGFEVGTEVGEAITTIEWLPQYREYICAMSSTSKYDLATNTVYKVADTTDTFSEQRKIQCSCQ